MKVVFAGSAEIAVPSLRAVAEEFEVAAVLTNPDRETGRGRKLMPNPLKAEALSMNLNVLDPEKLNSEVRAKIEALSPSVLAVFAYGHIFGPKFLDMFPLGGVNVHPSLLPLYRGSTPIPSAILNGDRQTGITVQQLNLKMDTGDILKQQIIELDGSETTGSLSSLAADIGAGMLVEVLKEIESGRSVPVKQSLEGISYCGKLSKEDAEICWSESAEVIDRKIRAFNPWPGARTYFYDKSLIIIKSSVFSKENGTEDKPGKVLGSDRNAGILIQTGSGVLAVQSLKLQSKKAHDWKTFLNGTQKFTGSVLGGR